MDGWRTRNGRPLLAAPARRWAITLLACCAVVVAVPAVLFAHQAGPGGLDRAVDAPFISWFSGHRGLGLWLVFPGALIPAGVLTAVIVACCLIAGRLNGAVLAAAAIPVAEGLGEGLLKPLVHRTYLGFLTYPSGHTTAVFAMTATVTVLLLGAPREGQARPVRVLVPAAAALLAVVVVIALIGVRFHYFTDTVGGAALGTGTVCGLALVLDLPAFRRWLAPGKRSAAGDLGTPERLGADGRLGPGRAWMAMLRVSCVPPWPTPPRASCCSLSRSSCSTWPGRAACCCSRWPAW
jgi:membrane-associated phospholipid phosphatase